jgi:hypothetical protein
MRLRDHIALSLLAAFSAIALGSPVRAQADGEVEADASSTPAEPDEPAEPAEPDKPAEPEEPEEEPEGKDPSPEGKPKGKPQTVSVDLQRLTTQLALYSDEAQRKRMASALIGLGVGTALVPSGLVLLGRSDGVSRALVIGMIVGGSAQLLSVPLLFIPTRMDEIYDKFMSRPADVESKATIRAVEEEWREAAEASQTKRIFVGTSLLIVGGTSLATGLTLLLAPEGFLGMSRQSQYTAGGIVMGVGAPLVTVAVRFLLEWSLEEMSWEAYRTMKSDANRLAGLRLPTIGAALLPGGAMAVATFRL